MESPAPKASQDIEPGTADSGACDVAATPASASPATRPVDVVVVTQHDDLLSELREALPRPARIRPVDSAAAAVQLIRRTNRSQVLMFDTRFVTDVRADVELAQADVPHAVPLLLVPAALVEQVTAVTSGLTLHAVLPYPIGRPATHRALDSAFADAVIRKSMQVAPTAPAPASAADSLSAALERPAPEEGRRRLGFPLVAACGVLIAGGGAVGWLLAHRSVAPVAPPKMETSPLTGKVDDLLENARRALRDRRFTAPPGDNALLYYRSALMTDPVNGEARDGLQRLASVVSARFDKAIEDGHLDEATSALADIRLVTPDDPRLRTLERQLHAKLVDQAVSEGDIERALALVQHAQQGGLATEDQLIAWRAALAHMQGDGKVRGLAAKVSASIGAGRLIEVDGNDARAYVQQMIASAPDSPLTERAKQDLASAYLRKAREAALVHDTLDRDRWLQEALAAGMSAADVESVRHGGSAQHPAGAAPESERLAGLFRERLRDGRLTSPDRDSAAYYLEKLRIQQPSSPELSQGRHELAALLVERARGFATQGKKALAEADLAQARSYGADAKDLSAVQDLEADRAATSKLRR